MEHGDIEIFCLRGKASQVNVEKKMQKFMFICELCISFVCLTGCNNWYIIYVGTSQAIRL